MSVTDSANKKHYYATDGLGSTTALTNAQGQVKNTYTYDVYGAVRSQTGTVTNEFKFTGEQVDATGMQYLRARYYDQATGRFLSRDPVPGYADRPSTQQPYAYALNNPCSFVDPSGAVAAEAGCWLIECYAHMEALGVGRVLRWPFCVTGLGCTTTGFPEGKDLAYELEVRASFLAGPEGVSEVSVRHHADGNLGWQPDFGSEGGSVVTVPGETGRAWVAASFETHGRRNRIAHNTGSLSVKFSVDPRGFARASFNNNASGRASDLLTFRNRWGCERIPLNGPGGAWV